MTDLLIRNAALVATVDADRRELAGGWVAVSDGLVSGVGSSTDPEPVAARMIDAATSRFQYTQAIPATVISVPTASSTVNCSPRKMIASAAVNSGELASKVAETVAPTRRFAS